MIPFIHIGPLTIPTFGLMVATGLLAAAYLLQADFDRHRAQFVKSGYLKSGGRPAPHDEGLVINGIAGVAGLAGPAPDHRLESPPRVIADPPVHIIRIWVRLFGR